MNRLALVCLVSALCSTAAAQPAPDLRPDLIPMFRFWDGSRHFYTLNQSEPDHRIFNEEGRPIFVFRSPPDPNYAAIFRCYVAREGVHFVSLDPDCDGETVEKAYGYISTVKRPGFQPLFALFNTSINDQVVTTNYGEGPPHGYAFRQILGFVPQL